MKFGREYKQTLRQEEFPYDFPPEWVDSAISYGLLKKCVQKVSRELLSLGFDVKTLSALLDPGSPEASHLLSYSLGPDSEHLRPKLSLLIETEDGVPVNAYLSEESVRLLKQLSPIKPDAQHVEEKSAIEGRGSSVDQANTLEIPLAADSEFFQMLTGELFALDRLQAKEEAKMKEEIAIISNEIVKTVASSRDGLYRWREIFELYVNAKIFFKTGETDHGQREPAKAWEQMQWFDKQLDKIRRPSDRAFFQSEPVQKFFWLNRALLRNMHFQAINQTAMTKILKKFNKKTALPARQEFPSLVKGPKFLSTAMSKAICYTIGSELLPLVPSLDDYLCPICYSVAYKPIRLACGHILCVGCTLKLQIAKDDNCPICRNPVIMKADARNLDLAHKRFLQMYFPREVKVKQKENERAANPEVYRDKESCTIM